MTDRFEADMRAVPNKRYFTIGEVSQLCQIRDHVLRYWETKFSALRPKRRQGRRYYEREDVYLVRRIQRLMQEEGYTLAGARQRLEQQQQHPAAAAADPAWAQMVRQTVEELEAVVERLRE